LTDRLGRKRLFYITLAVYLVGTGISGLAWDYWSFLFFRAITGAGIGGEYAAINSAIDELIPARLRGQVDLAINATYWIGAALGSVLTLYFLNPRTFPVWLGWRLVFVLGALLGLVILFIRHWVPESPRWLMIHGHADEAERLVGTIEETVAAKAGPLPEPEGEKIRVRVRHHTPWREIWQVVAHEHRARSALGFCLMASQAFFYNAIFFSFALVLNRYYNVAPGKGWPLSPLCRHRNALGPILIGRLFDRVGRKPMIILTYAASGLLLAASAWLFEREMLTLRGQIVLWMVMFFIASAAASSAYLTVSEIFPLEIRGLAISIFYAFGTLAAASAPRVFLDTSPAPGRASIFLGLLRGRAAHDPRRGVEAWLGVAAERPPAGKHNPAALGPMNYFITGTDTGVGKTYVTCLLVRSLRRAGLDTVG